MKLTNKLSLAVLLAALGSGAALAAHDYSLERANKVLDSAKTTLSQAISTAESNVGGKALSARLGRRHNEDFYDVRVLRGNELTDVHVGIDDGKILSSRPVEHGHMTKRAAPEKAEPAGRS